MNRILILEKERSTLRDQWGTHPDIPMALELIDKNLEELRLQLQEINESNDPGRRTPSLIS